jgi:hypothetical protein
MISRRELGRATLARQLLLERVPMDPLDAVRHLAGLQAQTAQTWYGALQSRLEGFDPQSLSDALEDRRAVRATLMRGTLHLVTAEDAVEWEPLIRPVVERVVSGAFNKALAGLDIDAVVAEGRRLLADGPISQADLGRGLQIRWPDRDRLALAVAVRRADPLIQATPRGLWKRSGQARLVNLEEWLGAPVAAVPCIDDLVRRYLNAFGPASVMDAQAWSGLTRLGEVFDRLRAELVTMADESGRELFDLPGAPRPAADTVAPVRYLYDFDNLLLSHADRSRFNIRNFFEWGWTMDGPQPSCLLIDGTVGGTWRIDRAKGRAVLEVRTFERLTADERRDVESEGAALLEFWAPGIEPDLRLERAVRS